MKSIEEIKDGLARTKGYGSWFILLRGLNIKDIQVHENEAAEKYARNMCIEQRLICYKESDNLDTKILYAPLATDKQ